MLSNPIIQIPLRIIAAVLITVAFLYMLSVASAQQSALDALDATKSGLSYSVARRTIDQADHDRLEQRRLEGRNDRLREEARILDRNKFALGSQLYSRLQEIELIARAIIRSGQCEALPAGTAPPAVPDIALWDKVQVCAQDSSLPPNVADRVKQLHAPNANPEEIQRRIEEVERDIKENGELRASNDTQIAQLKASISSADLVVNALQDVRILEESWVVKLFRLTSLPPRVLPIVLSFTAGLFGALLITLILLVYPNYLLNVTTSKSYWSRILVGGLIAVALYVVLGGGVAMVGSDRAVASGETNFMFFCAIGILAGMFSDRVASFLSANANRFAGGPPPPPGSAGTGGPPAPPPSPPSPPSPPAQSVAHRSQRSAPARTNEEIRPDEDRSSEDDQP